MLKRLSILAPPLLFILAAIVVRHELKAFQTGDIRDAIFSVPALTIAIGAVLTALNYAILSFYDWLALRYAGQRVPIRRVLLASSISYAISNNTGHALISGTSVRYRFYTNWGVPGWEVVRISAFLAVTFIIGLITTEVLTYLALPPVMMRLIENPNAIRLITGLCALGVIAYWIAIYTLRQPIKIRKMTFSLPSPMMALAQTAIAVADLVLAGFILYLFLYKTVAIPFPAFMVIYVIAMLLGLSSQVPGGLGIFEGTFLWLAGSDFSSAHILGALIVFRLVYYVLPLCIAGLGLLYHEARQHWRGMKSSGKKAVTILKYVVPRLFAPLLAFSGALLLFTGALPTMPSDIFWLRAFVPLGVVEFSHLAGSLIGLLLLIVSRGVFLRLDAAYYACIFLSSFGIAAAILQGLHWYDAAILSVLLLLFLPTHRYFDRKSSLFTMSFTPFWLFSILVAIIGTAWIGFFSYQHVDYANQLWWKFTFHGDAPRFLRALAMTIVVAVLLALYRLFGVAKILDITRPTEDELDRARRVAGGALDTTGFLALLGDKELLWSEDGDAFIMYAKTRRYWIAMGDPVGEPAAFSALIWRFREQSDKHGCKAVFYEVSDRHLPLYLDLGLALLKVGEEARALASGLDLTRALIAALGSQKLPDQARYNAVFELHIKERQFNEALGQALGMNLVATVANGPLQAQRGPGPGGPPNEIASQTVVANENFGVAIHVADQGSAPVTVDRITLVPADGGDWKVRTPPAKVEAEAARPNGAASRTAGSEQPPDKGQRVHAATGPLAPGAVADDYLLATVPSNAAPTQPYFSRPSVEQSYYDIHDPRFLTLPQEPYPLAAEVTYTFNGTQAKLAGVVQTTHRYNGLGAMQEPLLIAPAISVAVAPPSGILPLNATMLPLQVTLHSSVKGKTEGSLHLELPPGWTATPASANFHTQRDNEDVVLRFQVATPGLRAKTYQITAVAEVAGMHYSEGFTTIGYPGVRPYPRYAPAAASVTGVDVKIAPGLRVGYVMGSGDDVPDALREIGVNPTMLSDADLRNGDLSMYDYIVLGVRTYTARPVLRAANNRLLDYIRSGGVVITQYQSAEFDHDYGPYPLSVPGDQGHTVVEEDAKVAILKPADPLLNWPNKIGPADFESWVEERGHGFPKSFDPQYTAPTEVHDTGQDPQTGGLIYAQYGRGYYVYLAYAFFREMPEGVPGSFRIMANLLSIDKNPGLGH